MLLLLLNVRILRSSERVGWCIVHHQRGKAVLFCADNAYGDKAPTLLLPQIFDAGNGPVQAALNQQNTLYVQFK